MTATAYVLLNCSLGKEEKVLKSLCDLSKDVREVRATYGIYDIVVKVTCATTDELNALLAMVRKLPHLTSTISLPIIEAFGGKD